MAVYYDNPAGRLHRILETLRSVDPGSVPCSEAWARVLDVDAGKSVELTRRMVQVLQLPRQIELQVESIDKEQFDHDLMMRWYSPVESTLAESIFTMDSIETVTSGYDQAALFSLEYCSYILHRFCSEPPASQDELATVRELIEELETELKANPEIRADIRAFLSLHVRAMAQAIDDFAILGSGGLLAEFDQMVGGLIRRKDILVRVEAAENENDDSVWKKVWKLLARLATVLSLSVSIMTIPQIENPAPNPPIVVQIASPHTTPGGEHASPREGP